MLRAQAQAVLADLLAADPEGFDEAVRELIAEARTQVARRRPPAPEPGCTRPECPDAGSPAPSPAAARSRPAVSVDRRRDDVAQASSAAGA
jgi:hypothetical protein